MNTHYLVTVNARGDTMQHNWKVWTVCSQTLDVFFVQFFNSLFTRPKTPQVHIDLYRQASSVDIRATAFCHSYTGLPKGAQYTNSNWNFRFCVESRSKCLSMFISLSVYPKKIKTPSPKQKKQHSNTDDTTPSHHPLIIKTSQHHHQTSRGLHRYMPETSPTHH